VTRWAVLDGIVLAGAIVLSVLQQPPNTAWSPYYRVSEHMVGPILTLNVNGIGHQALYPADYPKEAFYDQIYRWFPDRTYGRILIVGAGSGTDTAVALRHGATHIDAVEIDPYLQDVGVRKHPDRPYDDPRVSRWIDDGRSFLRRSSDKYDLVVFALPDSLTLVSTSANIRLESFLFTSEAFTSVREHLAPNGVFVLYNYYREPWLVQKMGSMLSNAFDGHILVRSYPQYTANAAILAAGPAVDQLGWGPPPGDAVDAVSLADAPRPATDDWPFLYLFEPSVPGHYLVALAIVLVWAVLLVSRGARRSGTELGRFSPHFFALGIAFLLLETRSIVTFSLLFGSTWLVNALVFFAVLASVLLAIGVATRLPPGRSTIFYVPLFGSIVIAFFLPPASLLIEPVWLRYLVAAAIAFAPIFCANLVFSASFRDTRTADMAFASNLLGAMVGGAIEYVALVTGYQALLIVVALLYLAAYLFAHRVRLLGDRDLELEGTTATVGSDGVTPGHADLPT
jgi:spermine/spermidine synthase